MKQPKKDMPFECFGKHAIVLVVIVVNIGTLYWISYEFDSSRTQDTRLNKDIFGKDGKSHKPQVFLKHACKDDQ